MTWKPDYIDAAELKAYLRIDDTVDDVQIANWCTAASRAIDAWANRQFGSTDTAVERVYDARDYYQDRCGRYVLAIEDLQDPTGATVNGDLLSGIDGAVLLPRGAAFRGMPYTRIQFDSSPFLDGEVAIEAIWGWTTPPAAVVLASKLQGARFSVRRDSPYGIAGSPDKGSEMRLLSRLDPDVIVGLAGLQRPPRAH